MADFDQSHFPSATRAHWKVLLSKINQENSYKNSEDSVARRLSEDDLADFVGVRIQKEKAFVTFGRLLILRRLSIANLKA